MYKGFVAGCDFENNVAGIEGNDTYNTTEKTLMKVNISSSPVTTSYNGGKFLVATFTDENDKAIVAIEVSVTLNKVLSNLKTDSAGQINVSCDGIDPGVYVVEIKFNGDDTYSGAEKSVNVTVEKVNVSSVEMPKSVSEKKR